MGLKTLVHIKEQECDLKISPGIAAITCSYKKKSYEGRELQEAGTESGCPVLWLSR